MTGTLTSELLDGLLARAEALDVALGVVGLPEVRTLSTDPIAGTAKRPWLAVDLLGSRDIVAKAIEVRAMALDARLTLTIDGSSAEALRAEGAMLATFDGQECRMALRQAVTDAGLASWSVVGSDLEDDGSTTNKRAVAVTLICRAVMTW